jgi:hypothetical protein
MENCGGKTPVKTPVKNKKGKTTNKIIAIYVNSEIMSQPVPMQRAGEMHCVPQSARNRRSHMG